MAITVTVLMYSGIEDPKWELTSEQVEKLEGLLSMKEQRTSDKSAFSFGLLGYRGFIVEEKEESKDPVSKLYCFDGVIDTEINNLLDTTSNFLDEGSELELFLLKSGEPHLTNIQITYISTEIQKNIIQGPASISKLFAQKAVPPYDPGKWNSDQHIMRNNNCYNYANDKITNKRAQPGLGSGMMFTAIECTDVSPASIRDGQILSSKPTTSPTQGHYIALVVGPQIDYHWYRLDQNGMWSHKPGRTPAKNTDNAGNLISDPETCSRLPYTDFCGYFHCIPSQTTIR